MSVARDPEEPLPRRDLWLLPLVVLGVTSVLLGAAELAARVMFAERGQFTCGAQGRIGQKPNCVAHLKSAEGPDVEYRFNECGYRSEKSCGTKPPGTLRIVFMGTSSTLGLYVPFDETYAWRVEAALNHNCSRPVETQNMGAVSTFRAQPDRVDEALRLSPDVIVLEVAPYDVNGPPQAAPPATDLRSRIDSAKVAWRKFKLRMRETRFVFAAAHFMLQDEKMLYQTFLSGGGSRDVLSFPPPPEGERRFDEFSKILGRMMAKLEGSGVPLVVMAVPNRVAAAMVSNHSQVEGTDALWFGRHIGEIAVQHGALPLDVTPEFATVPHAERLFYAVDNHPAGGAHAIIARSLVNRLTDGSLPAFAACRPPGPGGI